MTPEQLVALLRDNPDLRDANKGNARRAAQRDGDPPVLLILPYPPSVNHYWIAGKGGARLLSPEAKQYKVLAGIQCRALGLQPRSGDVALTVRVYRPARRGDLDNVFKAVLDALSGYAYEDDAQVVEIHAFRRDDKANPRIEVEVQRADR